MKFLSSELIFLVLFVPPILVAVDTLDIENIKSTFTPSLPANNHFSAETFKNLDHANSISNVGDFNGDGFKDFMIGDYLQESVFLFFGKDTYQRNNEASLDSTFQHIILKGKIESRFGYSISSAGDINKDGYDDILVGAPDQETTYIIFGSPNTIPTHSIVINLESGPNEKKDDHHQYPISFWRISGQKRKLGVGTLVTFAGDVDKDKYPDFLIGTYGDSSALLFLGMGAWRGPQTSTVIQCPELSLVLENFDLGIRDPSQSDTNVQTKEKSNPNPEANEQQQPWGCRNIIRVGSSTMESGFGWSLAPVGDFDNDGFDDFAIGSFLEKSIYLIYGTSSPILKSIWLHTSLEDCVGTEAKAVTSPICSKVTENDSSPSMFGWSVSGSGDLNQDGYSDVAMGAWGHSSVYLLFGGPRSSQPRVAMDSSTLTKIQHSNVNSAFGFITKSARDINKDGIDDFIVGSHGEKSVYIVLGSREYFAGQTISTKQTILDLNQLNIFRIIDNGSAKSSFGISLDLIGDINRDSWNDILIKDPLQSKTYLIWNPFSSNHDEEFETWWMLATILGYGLIILVSMYYIRKHFTQILSVFSCLKCKKAKNGVKRNRKGSDIESPTRIRHKLEKLCEEDDQDESCKK